MSSGDRQHFASTPGANVGQSAAKSSQSPAELTYAWAATLVDVLVRHGVRHAVICPGSRSTPLALAFAERTELKLWPIPDERSAAFFALGIGMATGVPAAMVVTSGTAGANAYPAVIEASMAQVPMVVLTADRPPELHGFGALQTIDQQRLFGGYADFVSLPVPDEAFALGAHVAQALARQPRGVVHLNVPMREPLSLPAGATMPKPFASKTSFAPETHGLPSLEAARALLGRRTVIVAGPARFSHETRAAVLALAEKLQAPIFAEASSGFRYGAASRVAVAHYDALLRAEAKPLPELIIRVGGPLTTRTLQTFVDSSGAKVLVLAERGRVCDPNHSAHVVVEGDTALVASALLASAPAFDAGFLERWLALDHGAATALEQHLASEPSEPAFARAVMGALPAGSNLMLSNSMPIRDVDAFASKSQRPIEVFSSRGASGIDGVTSTAFGIAAATGKKTALLIGDTALLHDMGGLAWGARLSVPLAVVCVNNAGGRIFEFLPVAGVTERLESLFVMPPGVELKHVAAAAGAAHHRVSQVGEIERAVRSALEGGVHLVELDATGRDAVGDHKRAWAAVSEGVQ